MLVWLRNLFAESGPGARGSARQGVKAYQHLRSQALSVERASLRITEPSPATSVWGLLMEMGVPNGSATLLALADGTASLDYSSGGGVLGGHSHETSRCPALQSLRHHRLHACD
jgi:hypothetical protein